MGRTALDTTGTTHSLKAGGDLINTMTGELYNGDHVTAATEKTALVDADNIGLQDSAASNALKRATVGNLNKSLNRYSAGTTGNSIADDADTFAYRQTRTVIWDDSDNTLTMPTNGSAGQRIRYLITASGADRTITLSGNIVVPVEITMDYVITSGNTRLLEIEKFGSKWLLVRNIEFTA